MRVGAVPFTLMLGGCCCGLGGGGPSTGIGDRLGEKASEVAAEKMIEAASGGKVDISTSSQKFTMQTDEGTVTTWMDGSAPDGFPCTLPSGIKIVSATRLDPKDPAKDPVAWAVSYTTTEKWEAVSSHWMADKCGYAKATSTRAELEASLAEAKAQGVDLSGVPMGPGMEQGDMIVFESDDPNRAGGVMIDGASTPGTTNVTVSLTK